jgi:hypothetical protein
MHSKDFVFSDFRVSMISLAIILLELFVLLVVAAVFLGLFNSEL